MFSVSISPCGQISNKTYQNYSEKTKSILKVSHYQMQCLQLSGDRLKERHKVPGVNYLPRVCSKQGRIKFSIPCHPGIRDIISPETT